MGRGMGLHERAGSLAGRYEELAGEVQQTVARWRCATATSGRGDVEPLRLERMGRSPGRWLPDPPGAAEHEQVGLDAAGRVVCVRQHDATGEAWLARFAAWEADAVELACFRPPVGGLPAQLLALTRVRLLGGAPVESERLHALTGAGARERYRRERGRLVRVEEDALGHGGSTTVVKEVLYREDGTVVGIDALVAGGRHAVWRRRDERRAAGGAHTARGERVRHRASA